MLKTHIRSEEGAYYGLVWFDSGPRRYWQKAGLHRYVPVPYLQLASQLKRNTTERTQIISVFRGVAQFG